MTDYSPIYEEKNDNKWYWWDEAGLDQYGPYNTLEEAKNDLDKYCLYLDKISEKGN